MRARTYLVGTSSSAPVVVVAAHSARGATLDAFACQPVHRRAEAVAAADARLARADAAAGSLRAPFDVRCEGEDAIAEFGPLIGCGVEAAGAGEEETLEVRSALQQCSDAVLLEARAATKVDACQRGQSQSDRVDESGQTGASRYSEVSQLGARAADDALEGHVVQARRGWEVAHAPRCRAVIGCKPEGDARRREATSGHERQRAEQATVLVSRQRVRE
jgi:hypothetical protein